MVYLYREVFMADMYERVTREDVEKALEEFGGEEGVAARHAFRRRVREIADEFRDTFLEKPGAGPAERKVHVDAAARALDDAVITFQGIMNRNERKI
jgi:hypothetical protein